jgi:hypothetical protein
MVPAGRVLVTLGDVPIVVLADRMACLRATTMEGLMLPHPE